MLHRSLMIGCGFRVLYVLFYSMSGNGYEIDTISITLLIGQIVSKMSSSQTDGFSSSQTAHILPNDFVIAKGRPSVLFGFFQKFFPSAILGSLK